MRHITLIALALAVVTPAPSAWGQNLVVNPDFATDVAGWSAFFTSSIDWSALDSYSDPASGSGVVTNLSTTASDSTGVRQCVDGISAEVLYLLSADILVPSAQTETGNAHLLVQWYAGSGCGGGQVGSEWTSELQSSTPDVWYLISGYFRAPSATQSARVTLSVRKNEDFGTLQAHFDNVVFEEMIFGDGFESGDFAAWSQVVP